MKIERVFTRLTLAALLMIGMEGCKDKSSIEKETPPKSASSSVKSQLAGKENLIQPGIGMGKVWFGMTVEELKAAMGEPEKKTGGAFEYPSKGFAILYSISDGKVSTIMCGNMNTPNSPIIKACRCRTDKGIGMDSTQKDIIAAYGQPASIQEKNGVKAMNYPGLHARFTLRNDRVIHMIFNRSM